ncbi:MAG: hypothetical protein QM586_00770 [Xenophilus sp.]
MIRTLALLAGPALSIALVMLFGIEVLLGCFALVLLMALLSCASPRVEQASRAVDDAAHTLI